MTENEVTETPSKELAKSVPRRKRRRWLILLLAGGFSLTLLFGLLEVGLRFAHVSYPPLYTGDPYVGSKLRAGASGWWRKEGHAWVEIAPHGFRDQPRSVTPPEDTYRIVVLGDSYVEALQVSLDESFTQQLEKRLNEAKYAGDSNIEVLNFGVSGYGTAQELMMLRHHVWQYSPDEVILAFYPGNDIRNNSKALEPVDVRPYFTLEGETLVLDESFQQTPEYITAMSKYEEFKNAIVMRSAALQFLKEIKQRLQSGRSDAMTEQDSETMLHQSVTESLYIYQEPQTAEAIDAWRVTEALLSEIKAECDEYQVPLSMMIVSNSLEVLPDQALQQQVLDKHNIQALHYAANRIRTWCDQREVRCWATGAGLKDRAVKENLYLHGFENTVLGQGHWNELGHKLAAEYVASGLLDR